MQCSFDGTDKETQAPRAEPESQSKLALKDWSSDLALSPEPLHAFLNLQSLNLVNANGHGVQWKGAL